MSDPHHHVPGEPRAEPRPPPGSAAWAVAGIIFGVILLLPGACSVFFLGFGLITTAGILGLAIGALGIWMIASGISTLRRR